MVNRGGFSFVAMLVINPIVILFYQNCSMAPVSQAKNNTPVPVIERQIASESSSTVQKNKLVCNEAKRECPRDQQ